MGCIIADNSQIHTFELSGKKTGVNQFKTNEIEFGECVKRMSIQPSKQDIDFLDKVLENHYFLYRLPKSERIKFIQKMDMFECQPNTIIFSKDDIATLFFVIVNGQVQIITPNCEKSKKKEEKIILEKGSCFGDLALLFTAKRSATAKALTKCLFFCVSNLTFRTTVRQISRKNYQIAKAFIHKAPVFSYLSKHEKNAIAYNTIFLRFQKDQVIFIEGQQANSFYMITSGRVQLKIPGKPSFEMTTNDSFGQNAFSQNHKRVGTATVVEPTSLISVSRQSLLNCLGSQLRDISFYNILKWAFSRNQDLKLITNAQRQRLINLAELKEYAHQEVIYDIGKKVQGIIIVLQNKVNDQGVGEVFYTSQYFKTDQFQIEILSKIKLTKNGRGFVGLIKFDHLDLILSKKIFKSVKQISSVQSEQQRKERIQKLKVSQFQAIENILSRQTYATYSVADSTNHKYLIKCIEKRKVEYKKMSKYIERQREIVKGLNYKFIPAFVKTYEDINFSYLIQEFQEGFLFSEVMKQIKIFTKKKAQFYVACLILILEYLHDNCIIYRDLKPENIFLNDSGFLNIFDFTTAKHLSQESGFRTYTVLGTPHYMAPEVFSVEGYSFSSDLWSLGVIFYEMICGKLPFGADIQDPYQMIKQIQEKDLEIPKQCQNGSKSLMMKLLQKNPGERLIQGVGKLKSHVFFAQFDWDGLQKRKVEVPYKVQNRKNKQINKNLVRYIVKKISEEDKENL